MALRKINHQKRIISKKLINIRQVWPGDIIEFRYVGTDILDKLPLVFVIKKKDKILQGINLNYLREFRVQKIFDEPDWKKIQEGGVTRSMRSNLFRRLRFWSFVEQGYRTYSIKKVSHLNKVKYKTDEMVEQEREQKNEKIKKDVIEQERKNIKDEDKL